jgi:hypothetical protein
MKIASFTNFSAVWVKYPLFCDITERTAVLDWSLSQKRNVIKNKTKQNKTKQNKTQQKQNKTKKTKQNTHTHTHKRSHAFP